MRENRTSLLAKLAPMFSGQTENVAVEALGHILAGSQPARDALSDVLRSGGAEVGKIAEVRTQVIGEDGARPDLGAFDEDGSEHVLIEAKFWAGLTENQPLTYLQRLPEWRTSALLFVAPHARRESLWAELGRRIVESDLDISFKIEKSSDGFLSAPAGGARWVILVSWANLLDRMATKVSAAGDLQTATDIVQLRSLADQEDAAAFMPLKAEEIGPDVPRRLMGLRTLVDHATARLKGSGLVSTKGFNATPQRTGYIRYIRLVGVPAAFGVDYDKWAKLRDTPLWLTLYKEKNTKPITGIWEKLDSFRRCDPPELFEVDNTPVMPIELPLGLEQGAVLDAIVRRLKDVAHQIDPCRS